MSHMDDHLYIQQFAPGFIHHWSYLDHGMPVMIVARYEWNGSKTYRQFHREKEEWIEGMCTSPYPLFGLQTLKNPSPFNALVVTEGEKCASVLHQLNLPAIATALGAQNPYSSDWNPARYYKRFIILRDNDKAGISFTRSVSTEIRRVQPAAEIFVVNLTPMIAGGDLIDWLQSTVLKGQNWNGYDAIPFLMADPVKRALQSEIESILLRIEDCPDIAYKPIEALFEGKPRSFQVELKPVPSFPLEAFPNAVQKYVLSVSLQFSQVPDYAATALIASLGGLIGRSIQLKMRPSDSWNETANCWCVLVGPPSAKKSPILRRIFALFKPLEKRAADKFRKAEKEYKAQKRSCSEDEDFEENPPIRQRYITDDVTTPKLRELMAGNPRGLILRNDELKGQLDRLDKMGNEGDRSFMMSCWSGLEEYSEDRMCRNSQLNIPLSLTWIGCIPPAPLHRYLREAMGRGGGADGFMQRFQFVCYPDHNPYFSLPEEGVSSSLEADMDDLINQLDNNANRTCTIRFSSDAQAHFDKWLVANENSARSGKHPGYWESHLGKQSKVVAVLTIIIHRLKEILINVGSEEVCLDTLQSALQIQSYYLDHARRCYESVSGGSVADAEIILDLLRQKRLHHRFKAQDIYHQGLGGLSDSARVRAALDLLKDYGWVALEKIGGESGRDSQYWNLHPRAFEKE